MKEIYAFIFFMLGIKILAVGFTGLFYFSGFKFLVENTKIVDNRKNRILFFCFFVFIHLIPFLSITLFLLGFILMGLYYTFCYIKKFINDK